MSAVEETRIRELEGQIADMRVHNASLTASLEHLAKTIETLTNTVQDLRDTMNKGRGALWMAMLLAGAVGATLSTVIKRILGLA